MVGDRVQAFPGEGWETEFILAADIGFDAIELTIEMASYETHPVCTPAGRRSLTSLSQDTGVRLAGLCCDTFMECPLVSVSPDLRANGSKMLNTLLRYAAEAGLPMIEVPMLGENSLRNGPDTDSFRMILDDALNYAETLDIDILLETDLNASAQVEFLLNHDHPRLGINYDTGNSTYFGHDPIEEIAAYSTHIRNVHIKDCTVKDYSVPLGAGETNFRGIFDALSKIGYQGGFILQAARQTNDVEAAQNYYDFLSAWVATLK